MKPSVLCEGCTGGGTFHRKSSPHQLVYGLRPCLVVGLPEEERPTLKGGVKFSALLL